ncbi:MAG: hypothetical protein GY930_16990 [bacterium]|nr:hypothetical protein [bacterium]
MRTLHPPSVPDKRFPSAPSILPRAKKKLFSVKTVGPGRLERSYQAQVARLSRELQSVQVAQNGAEKELETARLIERGTRRFVDRLEGLAERREAKSRRALVLVGSLQHDNQILQATIGRLENRIQRLAAPKPSSMVQRFWSRLGVGQRALG